MADSKQTQKTNSLIRYIVEHTHHEFGKQYFRVLVKHLAEALQVQGVWVTEFIARDNRLCSLAFWLKDKYVDHYEYDLVNTPCEQVVNTKSCLLIPEKVVELFPHDPDLKPLNAVSYMGYPLFDLQQCVVGHLAILHDAPLQPTPEQEAIFNLFVQRANAEFLRMKAEEQLLERKLKLSSLVNSMHDAIVEMDAYGFVTLVNPAAIGLFSIPEEALIGTLIFSLLDDESSSLLKQSLRELRGGKLPLTHTFSRQEVLCINSRGELIPAEATICTYQVKESAYLTLLVQDIKALKHAQRRIEIMEERPLPTGGRHAHGIIGESKAILAVMEELTQAALSSSTILLLGESGTGKELFARFIHEQSLRKDKPLIKVNCAAIPANLIESEFFGHEKGAFTGAVSRREGRFSLAEGGTLFLDEVGELPLEMQPKLLRVLQEGEFEAVGGQRTLKVDVRIVAATNRELHKMVKAATFREDLYYRLNVIPVSLPPLRARMEDIPLLADLFIKKFSRQLGKQIFPLSASSLQLLLEYSWPGNIRELEHVMERAVIFSRNGKLDLRRFLPAESPAQQVILQRLPTISEEKILTVRDLEVFERDNIIKALHLSSWKIAGASGAASMLGIPPSTLNSKMKALGIKRLEQIK